MTKVLPVIHYRDPVLTDQEIEHAFEAGADGVFLISHGGRDNELLARLYEARCIYPERFIGINLLSEPNPVKAFVRAAAAGCTAVWLDNAGVSSRACERGIELHQAMLATRPIGVFASVAFKYQPPEPNPALAASKALQLGFIPTTSGPGTGEPPDLDKIKTMSRACSGILAIASGMTAENVADYVPFLSHILVATGVSKDMYHLDDVKLARFISIVRNTTTYNFVGDMLNEKQER